MVHEYMVRPRLPQHQFQTIWPMDLVFMSTFNDQSISIGCVGKLKHLSGFLRHYLLKVQ